MVSTFKKISKNLAIPALILTIMVGCSSAPKPVVKDTINTAEKYR